jgi:hypothetical protein
MTTNDTTSEVPPIPASELHDTKIHPKGVPIKLKGGTVIDGDIEGIKIIVPDGDLTINGKVGAARIDVLNGNLKANTIGERARIICGTHESSANTFTVTVDEIKKHALVANYAGPIKCNGPIEDFVLIAVARNKVDYQYEGERLPEGKVMSDADPDRITLEIGSRIPGFAKTSMARF